MPDANPARFAQRLFVQRCRHDGTDAAREREQHGFRKADTIQRTLEAELYFYSRVLKFPLADSIEPVEIENLA